ncbi:MAG: hypothetical protein ABIY55_02035 [Kofleriaceae bacterium]
MRGAWRKLPIETLVVAIGAIGAIGLVHRPTEVWCVRVVLSAVLVVPLALAAHRLGRRTQALAVGAALAIVLAAVSFALPAWQQLDAPRFGCPYLLALLAALLVPFVAAAPRFTRFVRRFFEESTTWVLLWLCALAALAVIGLALRELFDLRIGWLGDDAAIVLTCGFVLVYLDRLLAEDAAPSRMPDLWRRLATAIGAPFVSIMLVILVVYEVVVVVRGELPRNMLSPLILAAGFVGFVSTLILSAVVLDEPSGALTPADPHRWARRPSIRLARAFPLVLLVLLPMAGWALRVRIEEHGLTPFRVVRASGLLCLVVLSLAGTVRWVRGRAPLSWQVPATIAGFALTAAFGPLGAIRLSVASQAEQLAHRLDAAGIERVVHAAAVPTRVELTSMDIWELRSQIRVVDDLGGEPALRRVLSGEVTACASSWASQDCLARLGVAERDAELDRPSSVELAVHGRFATDAGELALVQRARTWHAAPPAAAELRIVEREDGVALSSDAVVLYEAGAEVARASLVELMDRRLSDRVLPPRRLPLRRPDGTIAAQLAVQRLVVQADRATAEVTELTGLVIWPR